MAIFSGKIITAHYINPEYSVVELTYTGDDGNVYAHALSVDSQNPEWQALLEDGWDQERLIEGTAEYKRQSAADFNNQVNNAARELAKEMLGMRVLQEEKDRLALEVDKKEKTLIGLDKEVKVKSNQIDSVYFDRLFEINENKEELFKFKLWALELDVVKTADKEVKSSIRKATRISQGIAIIDSLIK